MSEYNLKIRNKFINKLLYKINDLNENLELLQKVDKKIFKNIKGGTLEATNNSDDEKRLEDSETALQTITEMKPTINLLLDEIKKLRNKNTTFIEPPPPPPITKYSPTEKMLKLRREYEEYVADTEKLILQTPFTF